MIKFEELKKEIEDTKQEIRDTYSWKRKNDLRRRLIRLEREYKIGKLLESGNAEHEHV